MKSQPRLPSSKKFEIEGIFKNPVLAQYQPRSFAVDLIKTFDHNSLHDFISVLMPGHCHQKALVIHHNFFYLTLVTTIFSNWDVCCAYFWLDSVKFLCILFISIFDTFYNLKDFAMRSLKIVEDNNAGKDTIEKYNIKEERKWDERYNMYVRNIGQAFASSSMQGQT